MSEVIVFLARPGDAEADPALDDADRAHVARFVFERDRRIACASRALQRRALSACAPDVSPAAWRFAAGADGKPAIISPTRAPASPLTFNVSNTRGLVGCAVAIERAVGFDVEPIPAEVPREVVDSHFAAIERAHAAQPRGFAELWTQKEAYLKARGLGLGQLALDAFWFAPGLVADDAARWQVEVWSPTPEHVAAVCVERDGAPLTITTRWLALSGA